MERKKLSLIFIVAVVLILVFGFALAFLNEEKPKKYNYLNEFNESLNQNCYKENGICIYGGIPSYLKYGPDEDEPSEDFIISYDDFKKYFERKGTEDKSLHEAFGLDPEKWVCTNGAEIVEVKYFYDLCEWANDMIGGCGYSRRAFVCGDIYFVEVFSESTGPLKYGPFQIDKD